MSEKPLEQSIFLSALEHAAPAEREAYLQRACGNNEALRAAVAELLVAHERAGNILDSPPVAAGLTVSKDDPGARPAEQPGAVIGPYKLLEQIGEGGMGTVWMAQQTEPVKRVVALKLIKAGMDSKQIIARFEAERQALALMDHGNIAKVLDAGATENGRPYFVMDLVKGVPITKYCDEHRLTPKQRLELFIPVCQAVQHAHQKGIIHRDLKPSNVLVALYDGKPVPKVIDFGVAKAAGQQLTDKTLVTGFGNIVGTLEYMSPEQAELNQLDIDTRSDIYSLGVLLYELLAGSPPFSRKELEKAGMLEMLRVIREEEPSKPSTKLSTAEGLPTLAANRGMEPAKLTKLVRGELDWIVMKALEKDRNRRYETANGFAMDVQCYLADETVLACPPSAGYRFKKFMRRNKGPVWAAAVVLLTLVGGIVGTTIGLVQAQQARQAEADRADGELRAKERAEANFALAHEAVETYLGTVTTDPHLKRPELQPLRNKLLEIAIPFFQKLAAQKSDDPVVEAGRGRAYGRLGALRHAMGEYEAAIEHFEAAQAIFARLSTDAPTEPAHRYYLAVGLDKLGASLKQVGKRGEAKTAYREAQGIFETLVTDYPNNPEYSQSQAENYNHLGLLLVDLRQHDEAEALYTKAIAVGDRLTKKLLIRPEHYRELAASLNHLGVLLADLDRTKEAELVFRRALDIRKQLAKALMTLPRFQDDLSQSQVNLGVLMHRLRKFEEAEVLFREAVDHQDKRAKDFPKVLAYQEGLATSLHGLGNVLMARRKLKDAQVAHNRAAVIREKLVAEVPKVPTYRRDLGASYGQLGNVLLALGNRPEAEAAYRQAVAVFKELADDSPMVQQHAIDLGGGYCNLGNVVRSARPEESLDWYGEAIATLNPVAKERLVVAWKFLCNSHQGRATALDALGRHDEATRDWERALELDDGANKVAFRLRIFRNKKDAAGCLAAAAEYEALKPTQAGALYDAACNRGVCAAVIPQDPKTPADDAARLAKEQVDLAMVWLLKAVAAGYRNVLHMKQDQDLDALRERKDFRKLIADLEAKRKG